MSNLVFNYVTTDEKIKVVESLADVVWNEHYKSLLSKDQINYMLDRFQSYHAIKDSINTDGYRYYIITLNDNYAGYLGIKEESNKLFLSKLYILKEFRNKGLGRKSFNFLKSICTKNNLNSIYLTVNKHNTSSIEAYKTIGFNLIDSVVSSIGNNYVMDDYIMELSL